MEIIYRAIDGTIFLDKRDCKEYEDNLIETAKDCFKTAMYHLNKICELCPSCNDCPAKELCNSADYPWNGYLQGLD